jgi:hypothetical protein
MRGGRQRTVAWALVGLWAVGVDAIVAALVYRAAAVWLPTVGGGVVTARLLLTAHDSRR